MVEFVEVDVAHSFGCPFVIGLDGGVVEMLPQVLGVSRLAVVGVSCLLFDAFEGGA